MIADSLKNAGTYSYINERIALALKFLQENDATKMEPGRYEIDGASVYALVQSYESLPVEDGKWEAHRRYIDVQYVAQGTERMGYANIDNLAVTQEYMENGDYMLLEGDGSFLTVKPGCFAVFFPQDAHMPCIAVGKPDCIIKVVVKVLV